MSRKEWPKFTREESFVILEAVMMAVHSDRESVLGHLQTSLKCDRAGAKKAYFYGLYAFNGTLLKDWRRANRMLSTVVKELATLKGETMVQTLDRLEANCANHLE